MSRLSARSRTVSTAPATSAQPRTKRSTRSRRVSRTHWLRRGCSRISDSSTSARSMATTSPLLSVRWSQAKKFGGPVLVHVLTTKGQGYDIAVANENDQMHQANPFDVQTGEAVNVAPAGWTSVFRDEIVRIADERPDVVAITAAMLYPVGLDAFADKFPDRVFDVGIAEQHAVTSAAGLAMGGLHPVVAVYATFINRAFDQVLLDVALHKCGVTFVLDRAGVTGEDGASHNGMWDMSLMQMVPGLHLASPRDGLQLRELLREVDRHRRCAERRPLLQGCGLRRPSGDRARRHLRRPVARQRPGCPGHRRWCLRSSRCRDRRADPRGGSRRHRDRSALGQAARSPACRSLPPTSRSS